MDLPFCWKWQTFQSIHICERTMMGIFDSKYHVPRVNVDWKREIDMNTCPFELFTMSQWVYSAGVHPPAYTNGFTHSTYFVCFENEYSQFENAFECGNSVFSLAQNDSFCDKSGLNTCKIVSCIEFNISILTVAEPVCVYDVLFLFFSCMRLLSIKSVSDD